MLASAAAVTAAKYALTMADMALEGRWEGKVRDHPAPSLPTLCCVV